MGRLALGNAAARKQHSRHPAGVIVAGSRSRGACGRIAFSDPRPRVRKGGAMMKHVLPFLITIATVVLLLLGWVQSGVLARERMRSSRTPDEATRLLLSQVQARKWDSAHSLLANSSEVEKAAFVRDVAGSNGSLLTYASLQKLQLLPLHSNDREPTVRAKLHYSTAVGPLEHA